MSRNDKKEKASQAANSVVDQMAIGLVAGVTTGSLAGITGMVAGGVVGMTAGAASALFPIVRQSNNGDESIKTPKPM
jgi:hypothetical protein